MSETSTTIPWEGPLDDAAAQLIHDRFWVRARSIARYRLSDAARTQADSEDIANMALKSALSSLAAKRTTISSSREFSAYLAWKIKDKVIEAHRTATRLKRDPRREVRDENAFDQAELEPDPTVANAIINELATRAGRFIQSEPDDMKRAINELYFFEELKGQALLDKLAERFPGRSVSERTLYRHLEAVKAELRDLLDEEPDAA